VGVNGFRRWMPSAVRCSQRPAFLWNSGQSQVLFSIEILYQSSLLNDFSRMILLADDVPPRPELGCVFSGFSL
jgi:hypothetical protein